MKDLVRPLFRSPAARAGPPPGRRTRLAVTALEERAVPAAGVSVATLADASEWGAEAGKFRFTRIGNTTGTLTVYVTADGTATGGADYGGLGTTVSFAANQTTKDVTIAPVDDSVPEQPETVQVHITPKPQYQISGSGQATVNIGDNDAKLTFSFNGHDGGAIGYTVPWDQVDASKTSQSLPLSGFSVNLEGKILPGSGATLTTSPTIQFASGNFAGVTFAINTAAVAGYPYNSVSMSAAGGLNVTAVVRATGQNVTAPAALAQTGAKIDFSGVPAGRAFEVSIKIVGVVDGNPGGLIEFTRLSFAATATVADVVDAVRRVFEDSDVDVEVLANNKVRILSKKSPITTIAFSFNDGFPKYNPIAGGLKLFTRYGGVTVEQNDTELQTNPP